MRKDRLKTTEWVTLGLIVTCYGLWALAGLAWTSPFWPLGLIALPILAAFHTSLQHETIHGHPTRWPWLNEALVSLPLAAVFPYRRYKALHLQHHRDEHLTDPFEDPESYFWAADDVWHMNDLQRHIFALNNTLLGRLTIGPVLTVIGFARTESARLDRGEPGVRSAWARHLVGLVVLALIVRGLFGMPIWVYMLFVAYPALSLTAMRAYAEHQAAEAVGARSAVVETNRFWSLLYLNNNLHIVHHASPTTPWYNLPKLYHERRQIYLSANENTLFMGYSDVWSRFATRVKQPVAHPILHKAREDTQVTRATAGLGASPNGAP